MNCTPCGPAARLTLALGLIAGGWLTSATMPRAETLLPTSAGVAADKQGRILLAQAGADPVGSPVSYSSEQAERGEKQFKRDCEECHGEDLRGGMNGGAPLRGLAFEEKYFGELPASVMFAFMSSTMPPNSPGRYSPDAYADLMAYILEHNGVQSGAPLPSDLEQLDLLIMEK
jgi:mono/diheme cytochrome c family protein